MCLSHGATDSSDRMVFHQRVSQHCWFWNHLEPAVTSMRQFERWEILIFIQRFYCFHAFMCFLMFLKPPSVSALPANRALFITATSNFLSVSLVPVEHQSPAQPWPGHSHSTEGQFDWQNTRHDPLTTQNFDFTDINNITEMLYFFWFLQCWVSL